MAHRTVNSAFRFALSVFAASFCWCATAVPAAQLPTRLSETGLFVEGSNSQVRAGVAAFSPQYPLWSDGATKRRWIELPQATFIDATRVDAWVFPVGTRLWKEFSVDGRRVETRLIERVDDGSWRYVSYAWNEAGTDAVLVPPDGIPSLLLSSGRRYAIPSEPDCRACHEGAAVPVLGFSALQLSSDRDPLAPHADPARPSEVDLRALVSRGWLRNLSQAFLDRPPRIPAASPRERAVLGYLHGNCGHCHSAPDDSGASVPVGMLLAQSASERGRVDRVLRSLLAAPGRIRLASSTAPTPLVVPGESRASVLTIRMRSRDARMQMPPLGTVAPDSLALDLIERWIDEDLQHK